MSEFDPPRAGSTSIAVVGMGRVGLPLSVAFARAGVRVFGVEVDEARREAIGLGKMPFQEPGAEEPLREAIASARLTVHEDPASVVPDVDSIILCVGTPLGTNRRSDDQQLRSALDHVVPHLRRGQLLVLRSTVSPGTLKKVILPHLRKEIPAIASDIRLAACPERIAEGRAMEELMALPEIVGGIDEASTEAAAALFRILSPDKVIHKTTATSAELAKLFTNVYRYVNFALANEFAILGEHYGVDVHAILDMVNDRYPRANIPRPGPAGGPCLSKDGYFLVEELTMPDFVLMAWKLNDSIPAHVVRRLARHLMSSGVPLSGTAVAVLGRAFKRDIDDARLSPAERIADVLVREGAEIRVHDPFLPGPTLEQALTGARAFVLATNHSAYDALDPVEVSRVMDPPKVAMDCWGVLDRGGCAAAGITVVTFGVGAER
jgi:UDP-N-acetyl-D-mannosaminuronic acid dehydrogenase